MDNSMQGTAWSMLQEHLPYYAALLFSLPPVSFVLMKVALAARTASKQKAAKQWNVTPNRDQGERASSYVPRTRTRIPSEVQTQRAVDNLLRSIEMMRAQETTAEPVILETTSTATVETTEPVQPIQMFGPFETFEPVAVVDSLATDAIATIEIAEVVEMVETAETVAAVELPAMDWKPARPCRSRRHSSHTSRSAEIERRRAACRRCR